MGNDLNQFAAEDRILKSLRGREGVATAGDVSSDTGLPLEETENTLRQMLSVYSSHLDVDDDGNLLYRFDPKLKRRGETRGRMWYRMKQRAWRAFMWSFKVWIMVMLVGYTALFIVLLLAFAIAAMAAALSSDSDSGLDVLFLPLYLVARVLELVFWISILDDRRMGGGYGRRGRGRGGFGRRAMQKERPKEPMYKKIFRYVFGAETTGDPLAGQRAFAHFVRSRNGRVTAADWASRTGTGLEEADQALTAGIMRFRGDIEVSRTGELVYVFDDLRVTAEGGAAGQRPPAPIWERPVRLPSLTGENTKKANGWITTLNSFNLLMGAGVILSSGVTAGLVSAFNPILLFLGWIPLLFSLLFFAVPLARRVQHKREKKRAARENQRRELVHAVYLSVGEEGPRPVDSRVFDTSEAGDQLIRDFEAEIQVTEEGMMYYTFPAVAAQMRAAEAARKATAEEVVFGERIFSSDEETLSMADADLLEFEERLARELGGEVPGDFQMEWSVEEAREWAQ